MPGPGQVPQPTEEVGEPDQVLSSIDTIQMTMGDPSIRVSGEAIK